MSQTCHFLNRYTLEALEAINEDYLSKDVDEHLLIEKIRKENSLDTVYRFDIGRNSDGYSALISEVMSQSDLVEMARSNLIDYPDNHYQLLRNQLARIYGLPASSFVLSAGLESMIDHIARAFLGHQTLFLSVVPNFSVFLSFSVRLGARPLYLPLSSDDRFQWNGGTVDQLENLIRANRPKLVWISNPVNPTGQHLPPDWIEELVETAHGAGTAVVVDEAYGEYTDADTHMVSAAHLTERFDNLMVLRTFSKIHALPSLRVGYMICSNKHILAAVNHYRPMFPFSWFSLYVVQIASVDDEHVINSRLKNLHRRDRLYRQLSELKTFDFLPTSTNTMMLKKKPFSASVLWDAFARKGFLTADLSRVKGLEGHEFLRFTICKARENDLFVQACAQIEEELA